MNTVFSVTYCNEWLLNINKEVFVVSLFSYQFYGLCMVSLLELSRHRLYSYQVFFIDFNCNLKFTLLILVV